MKSNATTTELGFDEDCFRGGVEFKFGEGSLNRLLFNEDCHYLSIMALDCIPFYSEILHSARFQFAIEEMKDG